MPFNISDISIPDDVELEQALGNGLQLALMELDVDGLYLFLFSKVGRFLFIVWPANEQMFVFCTNFSVSIRGDKINKLSNKNPPS